MCKQAILESIQDSERKHIKIIQGTQAEKAFFFYN